ncbi:MAG: signal peptidase I [Nitrospirae bacterium]|nr:signal peptidase I [Nitrospirota bacterium]
MKNHLLKKAWEYSQSLVIAFVLSMIIKVTVVEAFVVPTGSMEPTIAVGDRFFSNKLVYHFRTPHEGEIVIFTPPSQATPNGSIPFVKRVIGVEGDWVEVRDGMVFVNHQPIHEKYVKEHPRYQLMPLQVPHDTLFVLGDNRNNSYDSHVWGFVPLGNIKAKATFRFWPLTRIGFVS